MKRWGTIVMLLLMPLLVAAKPPMSNPPEIAKHPPGEEPEYPFPLMLSQEGEKEALEFLKKTAPEPMIKRVMKMQINHPLMYQRELQRAFREKRRMKSLKILDPERYKKLIRRRELTKESFELAKKYREAESEREKGAIKKQMKSTMSELFEIREEEKTKRIEELEKELAKLKKTIKKRKQNKNKIIEKRMKQLIEKEEDLEW
jgi:hypothetical protein